MKLPVVSGDDVIKALKKAGFEVVRQRGAMFPCTRKHKRGYCSPLFQESLR